MYRRLTIAGGGLAVVAALVAAGVVLSRSPGPVKPAAQPASRGVRAGALAGSSLRAAQAAGPGVVWKVLSASTARRIENAYLPAQAQGTFLIMQVDEQNAGAHALSLHEDAPTLELGSGSYAVDAAAESALELAGHPVLPGELAADATATGWIAFDVPPSALTGSAKLCTGASACTSLSLPSAIAT